MRRADRGDRKLGGGVIDAFYDGLATVDLAAFDYVCKMDLDLDVPPNYFATLMDRMEADPRIGTCSGKPYFFRGGEPPAAAFPLTLTADLVSEMCGDENSVGMIKFFRVACFRQIGGFVRELMWDGIDGHCCRRRGWIAISWDDPELRFVHLRPMGTSHKNWWVGRKRHGFGQYFMGTMPAYMLASALFRMTRPPVWSGVWPCSRATSAAWSGGGRVTVTPAFRKFLRRYQWACLLKGKARATAELNDRQAAQWSPEAPP